MLHAFVRRFDVTRNLIKFLKFEVLSMAGWLAAPAAPGFLVVYSTSDALTLSPASVAVNAGVTKPTMQALSAERSSRMIL
jgi:hypothetical protein